MKKSGSFLLFLLFLSSVLFAQSDTIVPLDEETVITVYDPNTGEMYENYFETKKNIIAQFEGFPVAPFQGTDLNGEEHLLPHYTGRILILFFWNSFSEACLSQIPSLNKIAADYNPDLLTLLSFADDDAADLKNYMERYMKEDAPNFPIIPNARKFADQFFGKGLQLPRIFVVDKDGIVRKVKSGASVYEEMEVYQALKPLLDDLLKE